MTRAFYVLPLAHPKAQMKNRVRMKMLIYDAEDEMKSVKVTVLFVKGQGLKRYSVQADR